MDAKNPDATIRANVLYYTVNADDGDWVRILTHSLNSGKR